MTTYSQKTYEAASEARGPSGQGVVRPAEGAGASTGPQAPLAPGQPNPAGQAGADAAQAETARLTRADAELLYRALVSDSNAPLARRGDLVELHNRFVKLFETLNEGLGEAQARKAADDRAAITERLEVMEDAVNRMEGALRIEFEPVLRAALRDVVAEQNRPKRRPVRATLRVAVLLGLGVALGAALHQPIRDGAQAAAVAATPVQGKIMAILSPNGGSSETASELE
ncbi:hypothetical protein [Rhodosalinus sp. K401]|uniref:hypothetical protein n=1 Tax=Rhodosalinus sp. K401 TaxID=3239195 RepID=UPI0035265EEB